MEGGGDAAKRAKGHKLLLLRQSSVGLCEERKEFGSWKSVRLFTRGNCD